MRQQTLLSCFPKMHPNDISSMEYQLLKYRGLIVDGNMLASKFLFFCSKLQKDINDKTVDPYPTKIMVQPNR